MSVQVGSFDVAAAERQLLQQRQDGRRVCQTKRAAGQQATMVTGEGSGVKVQRMNNDYDMSQLQSASFTTIPSPPLYQQHWCNGSGGSFVSAQAQQRQECSFPSAASYAMESSSFPSSFRSLTPPESGSVALRDVHAYPFGVDSSFGLKQELSDEAALENPLLLLTPDQSPASSYNVPSPAQSDSFSMTGSARMLRDMDIFIPSTFRQQQQSPPALIVPSEPQQPAQSGLASPNGFVDLDDMSFFDLSSANDSLITSKLAAIEPPSKYYQEPYASTRPGMMAAPSFPAAVAPDHILINCDYLPELDLSSVTSVLDCLETKKATTEPSVPAAFSSSGCAISAAAFQGSRQVGAMDAAGMVDELLVQNLQMSLGGDLMWSMPQQQQFGDEMVMFNGFSARHVTLSY
jgi:hypothetical protein